MPKSYGNLLPSIASFSNLLVAYERARKGKQETGDMHAFNFNLEDNLWQLHEELSHAGRMAYALSIYAVG